ncbi:Bug family tripartite tricarboxylate transporter substrate binding protein [Halopiger goleimassiliensis]|uniref:Bug family tripartite tricarboxylate transporter substrate binding protein n=1 Tax=Halopiger goleimassiliensis TaxID=1293048 RepID=UPI000A5EFA0B|nr:tripartite tricarboxylate transporter substrate-binding protein [Halopiger goleimassiliensis]
MTTDRRTVLKGIGAASAVGLAGVGSVHGQAEYPSDDIRYIIPFGEGGGTDVYGRQMIPLVDEHENFSGVNIAIENLEGAASLRGTGEMMFAEPDGYTVAAFNPPSTPVSEMVNPQPFDLEDVTGLCGYATTQFIIVANPAYEIEGYEDLMDRYEDGELEIFSGKERGGVDHVMALLMQELHGFGWDRYVGYPGSGPAVQATIANEVPAAISTDTAAEAAVEGGDVDPVVSLVGDGSAVFPDLETVTDLGYENIDFISELTRGIFAPPGTPDQVEEVWSEAVEDVLQTDEMQEWSEETGNPIDFKTGDEVEAAVVDSYEIIPENVDLEMIRGEAT